VTRLADVIYRWRLPASALIILGALLLAPRADVTRIDNDITAWFSKEDPVYRDYERFRTEFGGTRSLIIALKAESAERIFSKEALRFIQQVAGDIERIDTVYRVDSLASATIVKAGRVEPAATDPGAREDDSTLDVRPLIEDLDLQRPDEIRTRALEDDLLRGDLVSEDGRVTAIIVSFDEERIDQVRAGVIQKIHDVVDPRLPAGIRAYYNGSLEISETYNRITLDNQRRFTPPIFVFTLLAIFVAFRSWRKTLLALFAILVSVIWTLGLYSLLGFTYNVLSSMIVPLVVVLAIADDVHIMQHWDGVRRRLDNERAFKHTVAHLATPLLGASATTALGMLSLTTSNVVAVRSFGIGSAIGVMVDFAISLVLVPTLLTFVRPALTLPPHERYFIKPLKAVARLACAHPGRVLTASLVVAVVAALGIFRLKVDTNHINFFAASHPLGESARVIDRELSGVYSFQILLEGPPESLTTPDALKRMEALQERLRSFANVRKVTSVTDYIKRINQELNDGREDAKVIPDDPATIAQELFVFTLGGEGRHELARVIASDYSRAQINIKLQSMSSDVVLEYVEEADRLARQTFAGTGITALTTGSGRLFSTLDHYLVESQLSSFATAFVTVFGVIFIVFRSFRFGILTIVPNVLPVIAVLGLMGYLGISMNIATVMVASVALGVVDDDTIHFINRYRREIAAGAATDDAIELATTHEGRASLTTAVINSCGFAVLFLSEYKPTAWFGGLLALTMAIAFLAEVFILPSIIKLLPRFYGAEALRRPAIAAGIAIAVLLASAGSAAAQTFERPTGYLSLFADYFPNRGDTTELRARAFAEQKLSISDGIRARVSAFAEGLEGRRPPQPGSSRETVRAGIVRVHEAAAEIRIAKADIYVGYGRNVWGRLDELQPTDVVNPLDVSRFFFEGRAEARLPVALVRGRLFLADDMSIEALYVPRFRRGRFDRLDEASSPFNVVRIAQDLVACQAIGCPVLLPAARRAEPSFALSNAQGGARFGATSGRVDWSVSAYRGFEPFGLYRLESPATLEEVFPRFTMIGADFETVSGEWGIRGEVAVFARDNFQALAPIPVVVTGKSVDAGIGVDRRAGAYRVSGTLLVRREAPGEALDLTGSSPDRTDLSLLLSAERAFRRERYQIRLFNVYTPTEGSAFGRAIASARLNDDLAVEISGGLFAGEGKDLVGRFADSDFAYVRLKYYF
jgi:predicted RND superfamily exporter protein